MAGNVCSSWMAGTIILALITMAAIAFAIIAYNKKKPECPTGQACRAECTSTSSTCPAGQACRAECPSASSTCPPVTGCPTGQSCKDNSGSPASVWINFPGKNMSQGDLGAPIDLPEGMRTDQACVDRCLATTGCVAVVREATGGKCWLKQNVGSLSDGVNRNTILRVFGTLNK